MNFNFCRVIAVALLLSAAPSHATLLSDSFLGFGRAALQDALAPTTDPFCSIANPAWAPDVSRLGIVYTAGSASLRSRAVKEKDVHLVAMTLQERGPVWSYGFFAILPTGAQPILDTGDPLARTAPWMNMNRQLLYAASVSRAFANEQYRVGLLVPVTFDAEATASTRLETNDVQSRASVYLRPRLSWSLGVVAAPENLENWEFSFLYKEPSQAKVDATIDANVPVFALDLLFSGESAYSFDPRRVSLGTRFESGPWSYGMRLRFSNWADYDLPYVRVTEASLVIEDAVPMGKAQDAWDLALGAENHLSESESLAFSVGWRQSPFKLIPSFYDADHGILGAGWRKEFSEAWTVSTTLRFHIFEGGALYTWGGLGLGYRI